MKTAIPILALVVSTAAHGLLQADDETSQDGSAKYKQLEQQIDHYNVDSPWSVRCTEKAPATCNLVELETTLLHLMGAEVRSWQLCDSLRQRNDEENRATASSMETILHEEVLSAASRARSALKKHANEPLLKVLITHLETYPYDWAQEGYEDLLPDLRKLAHAKPK